jgi:hypothetical protein
MNPISQQAPATRASLAAPGDQQVTVAQQAGDLRDTH